ncbi:unnamed protein product [Dovyalis caffra]|uniref:Uncharacterized protein n=1 Tax=Dovyalis caffra TaxID=77055 RepID=A0AAV1SNU7_9ROSI|nr:unnamed protein product [Dovyalis caffra]
MGIAKKDKKIILQHLLVLILELLTTIASIGGIQRSLSKDSGAKRSVFLSGKNTELAFLYLHFPYFLFIFSEHLDDKHLSRFLEAEIIPSDLGKPVDGVATGVSQ